MDDAGVGTDSDSVASLASCRVAAKLFGSSRITKGRKAGVRPLTKHICLSASVICTRAHRESMAVI